MLSRLDPLPQIVFILRKPSDRLYSWYQFARNNMAVLDPNMRFRDFVAVLHEDDASPTKWEYARWKLARSRYIDYLEEWLACFPPSQLHVVLFEHMRADQRAFMRDVASRLGIDAAFYDTYGYSRKNPTVQLRSSGVHRARKALARLKPGRLLPEGRLKRVLQRSFRRSYARLNVEQVGYQKTDDDRAVLAELDRELEPWNRRLAERFDLDLSAWR